MYEIGGSLICVYLVCGYSLLSEVTLCSEMLSSTRAPTIVNKIEKGQFSAILVPVANDSAEIHPTTGKENKKLGDKCSSLYDCSPVGAICSFGVCTCPPKYYQYYSSVHQSSLCQAKRKFGETCFRDSDCTAHDADSSCVSQRCRCRSYARFIKPQNSAGKCYRTRILRGGTCELDEQCFVPDGYKCKCSVLCDCTSIDDAENSIKIENIVIGVFASMAFLVGIQLLILLVRKQFKASRQPEQQHLGLEELGETNVLPSAPPDATSSQMPSQTIPYSNHYASNISDGHDLPPSYEDACKKDKNSWISSPRAFERVK